MIKLAPVQVKLPLFLAKYLGGYILGDPWINIWGNPTAVNIEWKKTGSKT